MYSTIYIIDNKGENKIDLFIEVKPVVALSFCCDRDCSQHPRKTYCELTETPNLNKETSNFYRFNLDIAAKSEFPV